MNATHEKLAYAKTLRRRATKAERIIWEYLKERRLGGVPFLFQHVCCGYIADFACHRGNLVIEIDGSSHWSPQAAAYDLVRDQALARHGWTTLRFSNWQVCHERQAVMDRICDAVRVPRLRGVPNVKPSKNARTYHTLQTRLMQGNSLVSVEQCSGKKPRLVRRSGVSV